MDMPPPEEVIATLPKALQPSYNKTLDAQDATHRAHMEAELKMMTAVLATLKETQGYLPKASEEEQAAIVKALWYFQHMGPPEGGPGPHGPGPMGPGPGGPGGPPMGPPAGGPGGPPHMGPGGPGGPPMGPPMGPPEGVDAKEMVQRMIDEVSGEIEHVKAELQQM
jgi:hypothetical protein